MCLGVPGKVVSIATSETGMLMGSVSFGGVLKQVCLDFVPEVAAGEFVIVHAGFAISRVDEKEAEETLAVLRRMGELERELGPTDVPDGNGGGNGGGGGGGPPGSAGSAGPPVGGGA